MALYLLMIVENNKRLYTELAPDKMSKVSKISSLLKEYFQSPAPESNSYDRLKLKLDASAELSLDDYPPYAEQFDWSDYLIVTPVPPPHYFLTKSDIAILLEMARRLFKNVCAANGFIHRLGASISLLFGLCSSQSSYIFRAFFGASLSRIPSL